MSRRAVPKANTAAQRGGYPMNAGQPNKPTDPVNRHIKLLRYTPRSGGPSRVFGAVWKRRDEVHWASPIVQRIDDVFDPQPFVARFPDAAYEFDHFVAAVAWLESVCYMRRENHLKLLVPARQKLIWG
ncbi:hypothetical protein LP415_05005 [Polaromonas sp. P1(28)-8]|nr:hypothetical protein LP415_05005 [Polaromonas sp. P1(28)-8]